MSEPREWWIDVNEWLYERERCQSGMAFTQGWLDEMEITPYKMIHVIERAAYDKIKAELAEALEANHELFDRGVRIAKLEQAVAAAEQAKLNMHNIAADWQAKYEAERERGARIFAQTKEKLDQARAQVIAQLALIDSQAQEIERLKAELGERSQWKKIHHDNIGKILLAYEERDQALREVERLKVHQTAAQVSIDALAAERDRYAQALGDIERIRLGAVPEHVTNLGDRMRWIAREALKK